MVNRTRLVHLDFAKALAMMLVVLGHIIVTYDSRGYNAPVAQVIYSFHTALFMFLSGYFFQSSLKKDIKTLIFTKSRQLLLPYFTWSVIGLLFIELPTSGCDIYGTLTDFCTGGALRNYWYVKLLFIYIILTWILIKVFRNQWIGCASSWLLFSLLPDFSFSKIFIPFFITGFLTRDFLEKRLNWKCDVVFIIAFVVTFSLWKPSYNYISLNMEIVPYVIRTMIGIVVSLLIVLITKQLIAVDKYQIMNKMSHCGTITLGIYLCHDLFYRGMIKRWVSIILPENNILIYILAAVCSFAISVCIVKLLENNKVLSLLFLGNKYNKNQ